MSEHDNKPPRDSAPDLQILGDQITFQPSGYVEPPGVSHEGDNEEALMKHMARFRSEPLQYVPLWIPSCRIQAICARP